MSAELPEFNEIHDPSEERSKHLHSRNDPASYMRCDDEQMVDHWIKSFPLSINSIDDVMTSQALKQMAEETGDRFITWQFLVTCMYSLLDRYKAEVYAHKIDEIHSFLERRKEKIDRLQSIGTWTDPQEPPQQPRKIDGYFGENWEQFVRDQIEENGNAELYGLFLEKYSPLHEIEKDVNTIIDEFFGTLEGVAPAPIEIKHGRKEGLGLEPTNFIKITAGNVADDVPGPRIGLYKLEEDDPNN